MSKEELVKMLEELNVPLSEETPKDEDMEEEIRVHFWEYEWEDITASGLNYNTNVIYQISVIADKPRHPKLLELKKELNKQGIFPIIQHEYLTEKRRVHSFFKIDILENIGAE